MMEACVPAITPPTAVRARPIFILGCTRSGTSLFSRMLGSHPAIAIPFESHLYNTFYPWRHLYEPLDHPAAQARLVDDILTTDVMADWEPPPDRAATLAAIDRPGFHGVVDALMRAWAAGQGKPRWGEKTPPHAFYWQALLDGFPDLQILHIVRDGRDVALSWQQARFGPKHLCPLARRWVRYLATMEALRAQVAEDAFHEIHYEALVEHPEPVLRGVCAFLDEPFDPAMLAFHTQGGAYRTDVRNLENLRKPVLKSNLQKWRRELDGRLLRVFEAIAGDTLTRYGYERAVPGACLSAWERRWYDWIVHPPRRAWAMLCNTKGHRDGYIKLKIYLRRRLAWRRARP